MDNNEAFFQALTSFSASPAKAVEYRVYYDPDTGEILNYTNEQLPGSYIEVDKTTFACHRFDCRVKHGRLIPYRLPRYKLVPSDQGQACDPTDVSLIVSPGQAAQHWRIRIYEED